MRTGRRQFISFGIAALLSSACGSTEPTGLQFTMDAPLCGGSTYHLVFAVDGTTVGDESLKHGQTSAVYPLTTGPHTIRVGFPNGAKLQETMVTYRGEGVLNVTIDFYCS